MWGSATMTAVKVSLWTCLLTLHPGYSLGARVCFINGLASHVPGDGATLPQRYLT